MLDIIVEHLSYKYQNGKQVLSDISFELERGKTLGIIGVNGSGKTTLCYCLCGIIPHYLKGTMNGKVLINGKDIKAIPLNCMAQEIGIVLQNPNDQLMMPTVEDEIAFGLENHLVHRDEIAARINGVINELGIDDIRNSHPTDLSGGEKQMVALAASLVLQPDIIIFDEVLSMLDELASAKIIRIMGQLKKKGKTLVIIDHTLQTLELFDYVIMIQNGKIVFKGNKESLVYNSNYNEIILDNIY